MNELIRHIQSRGLEEEKAARSVQVFLEWVQQHYPLTSGAFGNLIDNDLHNYEEKRPPHYVFPNRSHPAG